jgi:hypothetical protein
MYKEFREGYEEPTVAAAKSPVQNEKYPTYHPTKELTIRREINSILVNGLYERLDAFNSNEPGAEQVKDKIADTLNTELATLREVSESNPDPELAAYAESRSLEIEKMQAELDIRWLEKRMWDLHVDKDGDQGRWAEKQHLAAEVEDIKATRLYPTIDRARDAFKNEQDLLKNMEGSADRSERLGYIWGRSIEFETIFKKGTEIHKDDEVMNTKVPFVGHTIERSDVEPYEVIARRNKQVEDFLAAGDPETRPVAPDPEGIYYKSPEQRAAAEEHAHQLADIHSAAGWSSRRIGPLTGDGQVDPKIMTKEYQAEQLHDVQQERLAKFETDLKELQAKGEKETEKKTAEIISFQEEVDKRRQKPRRNSTQ